MPGNAKKVPEKVVSVYLYSLVDLQLEKWRLFKIANFVKRKSPFSDVVRVPSSERVTCYRIHFFRWREVANKLDYRGSRFPVLGSDEHKSYGYIRLFGFENHLTTKLRAKVVVGIS